MNLVFLHFGRVLIDSNSGYGTLRSTRDLSVRVDYSLFDLEGFLCRQSSVLVIFEIGVNFAPDLKSSIGEHC